jgi:ribosomal protein L29
MVSNKESFNPQALADLQQKHKNNKISHLKKKIAKLEAA